MFHSKLLFCYEAITHELPRGQILDPTLICLNVDYSLMLCIAIVYKKENAQNACRLQMPLPWGCQIFVALLTLA